MYQDSRRPDEQVSTTSPPARNPDEDCPDTITNKLLQALPNLRCLRARQDSPDSVMWEGSDGFEIGCKRIHQCA